jgi:hypothetical protein
VTRLHQLDVELRPHTPHAHSLVTRRSLYSSRTDVHRPFVSLTEFSAYTSLTDLLHEILHHAVIQEAQRAVRRQAGARGALE